MNNPVMKPAWAGTTLRLDPSRFPQQDRTAFVYRDIDVIRTIVDGVAD
ncbi:DUF6101 family protein, partial [Rhizobium ruizarguesonis]